MNIRLLLVAAVFAAISCAKKEDAAPGPDGSCAKPVMDGFDGMRGKMRDYFIEMNPKKLEEANQACAAVRESVSKQTCGATVDGKKVELDAKFVEQTCAPLSKLGISENLGCSQEVLGTYFSMLTKLDEFKKDHKKEQMEQANSACVETKFYLRGTTCYAINPATNGKFLLSREKIEPMCVQIAAVLKNPKNFATTEVKTEAK